MPVSSAEKPMTVWKKSEVRKTAPTRMPVTPSMTVVPDTSVLTFQVCGGTSGRGTRRSISTNATSSSADRLSTARVGTESQPCVAVPARPYMSAVRPPMAARAPGRSSWAMSVRAVVSFGRILSAVTRATAPIGTLIQKMSCQPAQVVSTPPSRTPPATPRLPAAPQRASAFLR